MLSCDLLSSKPCHSKRMYLNFVQYAVIGHTDGVLLLFFFPLSFYWNMFFIVVRLLAFYCFILFFVFSSLKSVRYSWKTNIRRCLEPEMGVALDLKKGSPSAPGNVLPLRGCGLCGDYTECRPLKKTDARQEILLMLKFPFQHFSLSFFSFLFFVLLCQKKVFVKHLCILKST